MDRQAKESKLYELMYAEAAGQYGAPGSYALERFMEDIEEQIAVMSDQELDQQLADRLT